MISGEKIRRIRLSRGISQKALAEEVVRLCEEPSEFKFCYDADTTIMEKLNAIAVGRKTVYYG